MKYIYLLLVLLLCPLSPAQEDENSATINVLTELCMAETPEAIQKLIDSPAWQKMSTMEQVLYLNSLCGFASNAEILDKLINGGIKTGLPASSATEDWDFRINYLLANENLSQEELYKLAEHMLAQGESITEYALNNACLSSNTNGILFCLEHLPATAASEALRQICRAEHVDAFEELDATASMEDMQEIYEWQAEEDETLRDTLRLLIKHGAKVNDSTDKGRTALHNAAKSGNTVALQFLIENGADIHARDMVDNQAIHTACHAETIKQSKNSIELLLKNGVDINATGKNGGTALHLACALGKVELAQYLIEQGANTNLPYKGKPMLYFSVVCAIRSGNPDIFRFIYSQAHQEDKNKLHMSILSIFAFLLIPIVTLIVILIKKKKKSTPS